MALTECGLTCSLQLGQLAAPETGRGMAHGSKSRSLSLRCLYQRLEWLAGDA